MFGFAFFNLGRRELSCPKLIQQIQEVRGNVIFGDTASGNPKQMRFGELDFPIGSSDSQQFSGVSSTPGPSNCNPHSIVDQLIDVALEVGESGSKLLHPILIFSPSTDGVTTVRKVGDKIFGQD